MSTTTVIKPTLIYSDASTRTYSITAPAALDPAQVKTQIAAFNGAASTGTSDINKTFVSDFGYPVTMIREAEIVITTEEEIYNG